jgi:hypothetical protein
MTRIFRRCRPWSRLLNERGREPIWGKPPKTVLGMILTLGGAGMEGKEIHGQELFVIKAALHGSGSASATRSCRDREPPTHGK